MIIPLRPSQGNSGEAQFSLFGERLTRWRLLEERGGINSPTDDAPQRQKLRSCVGAHAQCFHLNAKVFCGGCTNDLARDKDWEGTSFAILVLYV